MKLRRFFVWSLISLVSGLGAADHCFTDDKENVLQTNNVYTYHFRSVALAQAVGTTEDQGSVVLDCGVRISHDHSCYYNLELQDCKLIANGGQPGEESAWIDDQPLPDLSKHHVVFSLVGGEIKDVLVHPDDPLHYLNIKRGVLSAFAFKLSQTTQEIDEIHTDIHGTCPLKSVPEENGKVTTTKDMLHCHFPSRLDWQFSPWSMFWNMSFIQHVINSSTSCYYRIFEKRVDTVHCRERHAIMLESTERTTTAVQTNIFYYMDFVKSELQNSKPALPILSRKTSIVYEYEDTPVPQSSPPDFLRIATMMLSDLVMDALDEIQLSTIPQFTDFVAWIRVSHDLTPLVDKVRGCDFLNDDADCDDGKKELAFSFLSDALVQCNSLACAKAITYIARNDDVSPTYLNFIFRSWSYMYFLKPGFVTNFAELCGLKESRECWLSVGTFIRRIHSRNDDLKGELVDEMRQVATHFHTRIEDDCEATDGAENSHYTDCLVFLKAASNLGKYYSQLVPEGIGRLLEHAANDHSPTFVRTSALESIKEVRDLKFHREIYDEILPLLKNTSLPSSLRILAYDVLISVSEGYHLEQSLLDILKDEKDAEVKFYVADSLNSLYDDRDFRAKREKFLNSLTELLQENRLSLEVIMYETKGKSKSSSYSTFLNFPFMPKSMKRFGLKVLETTLFDSYTYPTILNQQNIVELFSNLIPVSKLGSYFEGWEELILAYQKNLADMNSKPPTFEKMYEAITKTLEEYGSQEGGDQPNFDENILSNIKKIHQLYWKHHQKLDPYAKAYLDLFGSTVKYMVQDSIKQSSANKDFLKLIRYLRSDLEDGVSFNTTKVIRVIEAYHQVPTMMGLPLNWTTNATLAFSLRAGLKYKYDLQGQQIHSKGFLQPSVALTFLNRMVVDFPTLTQIGVQANSSGYSSTELRLQYNSAKGKQALRIERPPRTQKVLELFRTNQLIKHNRYEDIADWDIERTTSSWCSKDSTSALQFCLSKSYPNVTHRLKPWALMAGWCKWQFFINPVDQIRVHYDVQLQQTEKQRSNEYTAKFSVTEKEKEKAVNFKVVVDENGKDRRFELKSSLSPDFLAKITTSEISRNKIVSGKKVEALIKIAKDFKCEMEYSSEERVKKSQSVPTKTSDSSGESGETRMNEDIFSLRTPYSAYKFNRTIHRLGENTKVEASVEYENLKSNSNWLRAILPPSMWADEKRATAKVLLNWKQPVHLSKNSLTTRQTEFRLDLPRQTMTLLGDSLSMKNREQVKVDLAKKHEEGNLESFLNFTYDLWRHENVEDSTTEIRQINLTIPRRSWALVYQGGTGGAKYKYQMKLKRSVMKSIDNQKSDYVGWWSNEVSDRFRLEDKEVKLVADFEMMALNPEEVLSKYPQTVTDEDVKDLSSSVMVANVALDYPFSERVQAVVFDGYFIMSRGLETFRFQKTFDLTSTYNNLQLTSNSVYRADTDGTILSHHSFFTYLPSQAKAFNTIHYKSVRPEGKCRQVTFKHDIRSKVFDLSTDASYKCETDADELYTLLLKVNTNSSKWNMLDLSIDQVIQNVSPDYRREDMTLNHPLGTIHTDAEWHGKHKDLQKRFVVCSKKGNCPNVELYIESFHDGKANWKLSLPNQNDTQITYERQMSSDYKTLNVKMGHSSKESSFVEFLDFTGEIIASQHHVWKGMIEVKPAAKVMEIFQSAYEVARNSVVAAAKDEDHPLNEILRPSLKMTLYDYWNSVNTEINEFFSLRWIEIKEAFYTLEAFTDPAYAVLSNTATSVGEFFRVTYRALKEKSVTIWAIHYFHLPHYFQQGFLHLPSGLRQLFRQLTLQEDDVLYFKFISGRIMSLGSFREWPSISYYPSWFSNIIRRETDDRVSSYREFDKTQKLAMIFGPLHVYTFDGHLYDIPAYPHKDCALLLAHDVHKSLFTVFSTEKGIHILFPEMSVTVDDQNEVFVNGSSEPTSLPIQSANGKVTIKRGQIVEVWSPSLSVECSGQHFLCILKLKEFHTGGVIGLLGNADENPDNEFMLPGGNTTSSLLEHVRNYEISGKPECRNFVLSPVSSPTPSEQDEYTCIEAFGDVCYSRLRIRERFHQACLSDVREGRGPCYSAAGLSALCHMQYMPSHTKCHTKKQETEQISRNLEVVLVVQESKHLTSSEHSSAPLKGIEGLLRAIDAQFKDSGYSSVLYSLVAFGGSGVHYAPNIHSFRKDLWLPVDDMVNNVLKTMEFKSIESADGVEALQYAVEELGYDSFASKVIIVVTVKDKQVAEKVLTDNIQRQLEENGITLYSISSYPSIEKGKKVFGVRADGLIFPSQSKDGDAYLDYPRGNLAKLTSSTRGALFLSKFLRDNNPPSFFTEFAQEVWAKVNKEAQKCRLCSSVKTGGWWFRNKCAIVHC